MKMKREGSGVEVEEMWSCLELGGAAVIYSIWYSAGLLCPRTWNFLFFFTVAFIVIISLLSSSSVLGFSCLWGEEQRTIVRKNYLPHPEASVQIISCRVATVRRRSVESSREESFVFLLPLNLTSTVYYYYHHHRELYLQLQVGTPSVLRAELLALLGGRKKERRNCRAIELLFGAHY